MALTGSAGSRRGSLYSVYQFLHEAGVRFIAEDETKLPSAASLATFIEAGNISTRLTKPAMEYRDNNAWVARNNDGGDWTTRMHDTMAGQDTAHGGHTTYAGPGFVHTSYGLLYAAGEKVDGSRPPPELFEAHPEWLF